jgi:membrane peptidoglycan carboxypeptidase
MVEDEYISQAEADQAFELPLVYALPATDIKAPHFVFYVKNLLEQTYGLQAVERGGLRVTTSLDLEIQDYAQATVSAHIHSLEHQKVTNGAALITKPDTGEILAMVGSTDYFDTDHDGQVNLTNRLRQPGSSIKPINYVTALQTKKLTPASLLLDLPTCFNVVGQAPYCPKNYDNSYHGPVQLRYALQSSFNIPAVKVLAVNGLETMIATASAMGIQSFTEPDRYGLSLTLGGGEVTMLDMATAFGTLANLGVRSPLHPILKVETYQGEVLEAYNVDTSLSALSQFQDESIEHTNDPGHQIDGLTRALNREPAFLMWHILTDNAARTPVFGSNSPLYIKGFKVAAKTGTTNDWRDNWTIGYTPQYVVTTWAGNNDNSPMSYTVAGITGAAPMFHSLMSHLLASVDPGSTEVAIPSGIDGTNVCTLTGNYPTDEQPCSVRYEYFWKGNFPNTYNASRKGIWIDKNTGRPAFDSTTDPQHPPNTDNLELQDHTVLSDPLTPEYCLDCNWLNPETGKMDYPVNRVDMSKFYYQPAKVNP